MKFNLAVVEDEDGETVTFAPKLEVTEDEAPRLLDLYPARMGIETSYRVDVGLPPEDRFEELWSQVVLFPLFRVPV